jgi:hypothetical protein
VCKREAELQLSRRIRPAHTSTGHLAVPYGITVRH